MDPDYAEAVEWMNEFVRNEALGLVEEDKELLNGLDHLILFEGQIGPYIRASAWQQSHLDNSTVDYVRVWFDLYDTHRDPGDDKLNPKEPIRKDDIFMTKTSFLRVMGSALASIKLWNQ